MRKSVLKDYLLVKELYLLLFLIGLFVCGTTSLNAQRTFDDDSINDPMDSLRNNFGQVDSIGGNDRSSGNDFLEKDTLDIPNRISQVRYLTNLEFGNWEMPDTNITNQQYYLPTEQPFNHFRRLGGLGLHHYPTLFQANANLKFDWGYNNLNQYPMERRYFQANYPLTQAQYVWGYQNEQYFRTMHTQNLNPFLNVLVDYQVGGSEGLYFHQKTNFQNLLLGSSFQAKNGRYQNHVTWAWNRYKLEQNGGVNDSRLNSVATFNKPALTVNLENARHDNRDQTLNIWHAFDFGFHKPRKDSVKIKEMIPQIIELNAESATPLIDALLGEEDTLNTLSQDSILVDSLGNPISQTDTMMIEVERDSVFIAKDFYPSFRLFHNFDFINDKHHYGDNSFPIDFYPAIYNDSLLTDDTLSRKHFRNEVGLLFLGNNFLQKDTSDTHLRAKFSLTHEYIRLHTLNTLLAGQIEIPDKKENVFVQFKFFNQRKKLQYFMLLEKGIVGWNANGWKANLKANYELPFGVIGVEYLSSRQAPAYVYTRISTNHHRWINENLNNTTVNKIGANLNLFNGNLKLAAAQFLVDNHTYFNKDQAVSQLTEQLSVQQVSLSGKANKGKWHAQAHLLFQNTNNSNLPIPNLMLTSSVWYETKIYNSMRLEIGALIEYNSNYFTPLFAPSMEQFYWQDSNELSFYPQFDLFINARVRTVRFIIRTQNMMQDLFQASENTYVEGYPMLDRGVKLGVTWWFFD